MEHESKYIYAEPYDITIIGHSAHSICAGMGPAWLELAGGLVIGDHEFYYKLYGETMVARLGPNTMLSIRDGNNPAISVMPAIRRLMYDPRYSYGGEPAYRVGCVRLYVVPDMLNDDRIKISDDVEAPVVWSGYESMFSMICRCTDCCTIATMKTVDRFFAGYLGQDRFTAALLEEWGELPPEIGELIAGMNSYLDRAIYVGDFIHGNFGLRGDPIVVIRAAGRYTAATIGSSPYDRENMPFYHSDPTFDIGDGLTTIRVRFDDRMEMAVVYGDFIAVSAVVTRCSDRKHVSNMICAGSVLVVIDGTPHVIDSAGTTAYICTYGNYGIEIGSKLPDDIGTMPFDEIRETIARYSRIGQPMRR
jgi:hypothetical protein